MESNQLWRENKIVRKYRHRKLPSKTGTRIIELLPAADPSEDLRCRIRLVELGDAEKAFEAVSYTWGDASLCRDLLIVGDDEKAHHITLMASIYSMASQVLIWLGHDAVGQEAVRVLGQRPLTYDDVPCVQKSVFASWFSRRWVIQEAVLNPEAAIFCGSSGAKFDIYCRRLLDLRNSPRHARTTTADITRRLTAVDSISMLRKLRYGNPVISKPDASIMTLVMAFDEFACKDPRDRVYTLASLAKDTTLVEVTVPEIRQFISQGMSTNNVPRILPVMVNYEAAVEDVYTLFAYLVAAAGRIDWLFRQVCARQGRFPPTGMPQTLPSWVPDWSVVDEGHLQFWENPVSFYDSGSKSQAEKYLSWLEPSLKSVNTTISGPSGSIPAYRIRTPLGRIVTTSGADGKTSLKIDKSDTAPLSVVWRSEEYPAETAPYRQRGSRDSWLKSMFSTAWNHALCMGWETDTVSQRLVFADRLAYVLLAGGMFENSAQDGTLEDPDKMFRYTNVTPDVLRFHIPIKLHPLLQDLTDGMLSQSTAWSRTALTKVMDKRRVFVCEIMGGPSSAGSRPIFGIGPYTLEVGDRIISIPAANKELRPAGYPAWESLPKDAPLRAYNVWANTFVVRDTVRWLPPSMGLMPKEWFDYPSRNEEEAKDKIRFAGNYSYFDKDGEIYMV
ncbi:ankyrin and het domain protein [Colletotrichum musicola]|uniref:Ankyrin and het domain protein n=1 Tax=Colletotrichum musicola TaxID=2175873 RepID=A0A8H6N9V2_9PEZI|nr:ankyrin and het domain protein [Colletotrichum musicola]